MSVENLTDVSAESQAELREITARLSCFSAPGAREYTEKFHEHLALHGLAKLPPGFRSPIDVFHQLQKTIKIPVDYSQLLAALERLAQRDSALPEHIREVEQRYNDHVPEFRLKTEKISGLTQEHKAYLEFENQVIQVWEEELARRYPNLQPDDLAALKTDLTSFSYRFYAEHSIENLALYFGNNENLEDLLEKMDQQSLDDILPEAPNELVSTVRKIELPRFFYDAPPQRRQYISRQLNSVFLLHMMQLDPNCSRLVSQHITGGTLFLDTNFIYRLLGLNDRFGDTTLAVSAKKLLEKSRILGYTPVVSPRTISEYKTSLNYAMRRVQRYGTVDPNVGRAASAATNDSDFLMHYWRLLAERNGIISPDSFYSHYSQIEILLEEQFGVTIDSSHDKHIRSNIHELAKEEALLRNSLPGYLPPHEDIVTHDAHMRLLILNLRQGSESASALETRYWFLTCDTKLITYDRRARARHGLMVPFCVLSSQWARLITPFATTPEEYELMYSSITESSILRSFPMPKVEHIQSIIEKMAFNQQIPPSATARMLLDEAFVKSFSEKVNEEEQKQFFEDYFYGEFVVKLEQEQAAKDEEILKLKERIKEISELAEQERSQSQETHQALVNQVTTLEKQISDITAQLNSVKQTAHNQPVVSAETSVTLEEIAKLRADVAAVRSENERLLAQNKAQVQTPNFIEAPAHPTNIESRASKIIALIVVWLLCLIAFVITRPWESTNSSRYLIFSFPIISLALTQVIYFWKRSISRISLSLIVAINVLSLIFAVLLPMGIQIPDIIYISTYTISLVAGIASLTALLPGESKK